MKVFLFAMALGFSVSTQAQFFESVKKPSQAQLHMKSAIGEVQPLKQFAFRPSTNLASFVISDDIKETSIITGAGVSAQWLKYNTETEKWNIVVSINALAYGRIALSNESNGKKFMYGGSIGMFDNLVMIGFATDGKKGYGTMGVGIPLNNL